jgi:hypothetical protein
LAERKPLVSVSNMGGGIYHAQAAAPPPDAARRPEPYFGSGTVG